MAISVVMPALEMAQETGKLLAWRKKEGESVRKGEPLLEIETDKAVVEVEAPGDGMLAGITADVGAVIPVGETIAWLVAPGEQPPVQVASAAPGARSRSGGAQQTRAATQAAAATKTAVANAPPEISPKARRLANELLEAQKVWSDGAGKSQSTAGTITDLLVALVARALGRHPRMNASWTDEGIRANRDINVSVAVAVNDGVVGVVVHKADTLEIEEISTQRRQLTERARAGRLRPADITGGTFKLSNLGMYKVDAFSAIITPPQAAVLAVGAVSERVGAVEGKPAVRPMMTMTLSSDHRVVDGARAAEFLSDLAGAMREPMKLL